MVWSVGSCAVMIQEDEKLDLYHAVQVISKEPRETYLGVRATEWGASAEGYIASIQKAELRENRFQRKWFHEDKINATTKQRIQQKVVIPTALYDMNLCPYSNDLDEQKNLDDSGLVMSRMEKDYNYC